MPDLTHIKTNVEAVKARIEKACTEAGRDPCEVVLCAVTKNRSVEEVRSLLEAGVRIIGENRVQEAMEKITGLERNFELHFIGHLQTNKAASAVSLFDAVQSVDSVRLARTLSGEAQKQNRVLSLYVQVNSSGEASKSGFEPESFIEETGRILELPGLTVRGVMTIGPLTDDETAVRRAFALTRGLFEKLRKSNPGIRALSMGMSDDLEIAVSEGATLVRVGRALFERR